MYLHNIIVRFGAAIWRHTSSDVDGKWRRTKSEVKQPATCKMWAVSQGVAAEHSDASPRSCAALVAALGPKFLSIPQSKKFLDAVAAIDGLCQRTWTTSSVTTQQSAKHGGISAEAPQGVAERTRNCWATAVQEAKTPCSARRTKPQR